MTTTHNESIAASLDDLPMRDRKLDLLRRCSPDYQAPRIKRSVSVGPWLKAAHAALNRERIHRPIDQTVLAFQDRSESRVIIELGPGFDSVKVAKCLTNQCCAHFS